MASIIRTVHRGLIRIDGNTYYSPVLAEYHGQELLFEVSEASPPVVTMNGHVLTYESNKHRYISADLVKNIAARRQQYAAHRMQQQLLSIHRLQADLTQETGL